MDSKQDFGADEKGEPKQSPLPRAGGRGRRSRAGEQVPEAESKGEDQSNTMAKGSAPESSDTQQAARPRRRRAGDSSGGDGGDGGGWMTGGGGKSSKTNAADEGDDADFNLATQNKDKHFQDDGDEIVLIPDLDEDGGADADQRIAHAPRNVHRRIPTLADLESEAKATVPTTEEGLNLSVLLSTLVPAGMVTEEDVPWTFESLLREITDELSNTPKTVVSTTIPGGGGAAGGSSGGAGDNKSTSSTKAVAGKSKGSSSGGGTRGVDGFDGFNKRAGGEGAGARK